MTFIYKRLAAALAFAAMGAAAHADVLVVKPGGATFTGLSTFSFSAELLGALDIDHASVANYGMASSVIDKDIDGYFVSVASTAPMQSLTIDTDSLELQGMSSRGGLTVTAPFLKSVTSGGSLTITDIATDLTTKTIYATLIGANGVGTLNNVAMWTFDKIEGPTRYGDANPIVNDITGLVLTTDGLSKWSQALGLMDLGHADLQLLTDFGSLHTVTSFSLCCAPTPSVPEPANHTLMGLGLGLGVLGAVAARRKPA